MRPALNDEGLVVKTLSGGGGLEARVLVDLKQPFGVVQRCPLMKTSALSCYTATLIYDGNLHIAAEPM